MSSGRRIAGPAVLLALLTGCGLRPHKAVLPVAAQAPSLPPSQMAVLISPLPPLLPVVWERPIKLDTTTPPEPKPEVAVAPPHRPPRRHTRSSGQETAQQESKPPAQTPAEQPAQNEQAAATTGQPSEMSPIGQLSTSNDDANITDHNEISKQIDETENALNAIKRPLSAEEQKTVEQIRTYIKVSREALKNDDLAGARNTSTKAHLLLLELTR
ncbi:MAG TPA: hypothetical protein VHX37_17600 [Acidobacteriaceae bacterium]|jgi:hypothetical protein|nr:hypothetical protein [Acidobacteriaceae bacterium]